MLTKLYPPWIGGLELHVAALAQALDTLGEACVSVVTGQQGRAPASVERTARIDVFRARTLARVARTPITLGMRSLIRQTSPDVMHFHSPHPWGELVAPISRHRTPVVVTYHHDVVRQRMLRPFYEPVLQRVLTRADRIIVWSPQLRDSSPALQAHRHKVVVIPGGIDTARFIPTPQTRAAAGRLRTSLAPTGPVILFIGRLVYYKGLHHLLRALQDVPATLVLVGTGAEHDALVALAVELGVADRVHFVGEVSDDMMPLYLQASDVLVLPSCARTEAFGLVQLEAHASGIPTISTSLPTGVAFVNEDGVTGQVVPPANSAKLAEALNLLLGNDDLRRRLGAQAQRRAVERFDIRRCARDVMDLYRELTDPTVPASA